MPAYSKNLPQFADQDIGFKGMVSRIDAALLEPGFVSRAVNRRFDQGKIRNRWGVVRPPWGGKWVRQTRTVDVDPNTTVHYRLDGAPIPPLVQFVSDPFTPAKIFPNGSTVLQDDGLAIETSAPSFNFNATHKFSFYDYTAPLPNTRGILAYRDADSGAESLLVAVDEPRADGGNGKVYILRPGQSHMSILSEAVETVPMNGHDFYGPVRMIRAAGAVVMLRPGPIRYYFTGADIFAAVETPDYLKSYFNLAVIPDFAHGTKVQIVRLGDAPPIGEKILDDTHYFARRTATGNGVELFSTRALAQDPLSVAAYELTPGVEASRYYLLVAESVDWWSQAALPEGQDRVTTASDEIVNDGPPLIMQASKDRRNPLDAGFDRVPSALVINEISEPQKTITVVNHRLAPGERIVITHATSGVEKPYYVHPLDAELLQLYDGQLGEEASLSGSEEFVVEIKAADQPVDSIVRKSGASGAPMPSGREGIYFGNRLVIVYGFDHLAVSDVLDPLSYMPLISEFKLNTGTNDPITAIYPFNQTTILIFKERSVLAIENIYGDMSSVKLVEITREFGCLAARTICSTGSDVVFLSQRGVVSMKQTEFGIQQSVVLPLSDAIQPEVDVINQVYAASACAAYWDNRYILSAPSETGDGSNDLTLVFNFLNQAWDGIWQGKHLIPIEYERLDVNGTLRLLWADASGYIHYYSPDAVVDPDGEVLTELKFRAHTCGQVNHKQWTDIRVSLASFRPNMTLLALFDGVAEALPLAMNWTRDRTKYMRFGIPPYDPLNGGDDFLDPYREDYTLLPGFQLQSGVRVSLHQQFNFRTPVRTTGAYMQPVLLTSQGSIEVYSVQTQAVPSRVSGQIDS